MTLSHKKMTVSSECDSRTEVDGDVHWRRQKNPVLMSNNVQSSVCWGWSLEINLSCLYSPYKVPVSLPQSCRWVKSHSSHGGTRWMDPCLRASREAFPVLSCFPRAWASLYAEWARPGRTDDTVKQKRDEEGEEERPDAGGVERAGRRNDRMDVEMRHCVAGEQGKGGRGGRFGKGGQVNWQPFRGPFELQHINPHLTAAGPQTHPLQKVDPGTLREPGPEGAIIGAGRAEIQEEGKCVFVCSKQL